MDRDYDGMNAIELLFYYMDLDKNNYYKVLDSCLNKMGIAIDQCLSFAFANEYEDYEEGFFGSYGVKIVVQEPLVEKDKEEIYELIDFYKYS